ncbi:hypothetical protein HMPREF1546_01887 [Oscillibacter sp. KLE 1745]|nr:hypothetical protein HMPREF1546_01887 [Oscillibacter sp. KLE 1745]
MQVRLPIRMGNGGIREFFSGGVAFFQFDGKIKYGKNFKQRT